MKKKINLFYSKTIIFCGIMLFSVSLSAQLKTNSPYSRFGLGELRLMNNVPTLGMGGAGLANLDSTRINALNPAGLIASDSGFFYFDAGFTGRFVETKSSQSFSQGNYFNLNHFQVAFPVTRKYKMGFGLNPYSEIGYNVTSSNTIDSIGQVDYEYIGDGGLNSFHWGHAIKLHKNLTAGVKFSYLFGTLNTYRTSEFADVTSDYKYRVANSYEVYGFNYDLGLIYKLKLSEKNHLNLAFTFAPKTSLNAYNTIFAETYTSVSDDYESIKDTIFYNKLAKGKVVIPMKIGAGFSFISNNNFRINGDVEWQKWSDFTSYGIKDSLVNSLQYRLGMAYTFKKVDYRIGAHYNNTSLQLRNTQIQDIGVSLGAGFLLRRINQSHNMNFSYVDLGIEFGKYGTLSQNLVQQNYIKFYMSLSIKNEWFRKEKFQ